MCIATTYDPKQKIQIYGSAIAIQINSTKELNLKENEKNIPNRA